MIKSFRCKDTEELFYYGRVRQFRFIEKIALRKLKWLDSASDLRDLRTPPGNRLEMLKGDRHGQCSIRINVKWRICFKWVGKDAFDVEIVDYHK